jgi:chlorobactene glucosyltransferase
MMMLIGFVALCLIVISLNAIVNALLFPRLRRVDGVLPEQPLVSILVPARNEAAVIETTIRALLAQSYRHFELIVLDDASTDGTGELARAAGNGDPRLKVIPGVPLPDGWTGKNHACHLLSKQARGDILLFTDADTRWQPDALAALLALMQTSRADLLTVWSTQDTHTPAERLVVPLIALAVVGYLPLLLAHYSPFPAFAAANGQCMAWRREAYRRIGGHAAVADSVLDDVRLARAAVQAGLSLRMADGAGLLGCRMYTNWQTVRDGFAKNILAGYGGSLALLALATVFHLLVFVAPWVWLLLPPYRLWGLLLILPGIGVRALSAAVSRQRIRDALWLPVSVLLMTLIAWQAVRWHLSGGPRWKGRLIRVRSAAHG